MYDSSKDKRVDDDLLSLESNQQSKIVKRITVESFGRMDGNSYIKLHELVKRGDTEKKEYEILILEKNND